MIKILKERITKGSVERGAGPRALFFAPLFLFLAFSLYPLSFLQAATKIFLRDNVSSIDPGADDERRLIRFSGSTVVTYVKDTILGPVTPPTVETQFTFESGGTEVIWYSYPIDAVTISGDVTFNIWAMESATKANATITAELLRSDNAGAILSVIASVLIPRTELTTTLAKQNWLKAPTSTAMSNGDRLALRIYIDDGDGVTMSAANRTVSVTLNGGTVDASGDSWTQVGETLAPARPITTGITEALERKITAGWDLVDDATGYILAASLNPDNPPSIYASSETQNTSATVYEPALEPNTTYYLFVRTNGSGASSSWSTYPGTSTLANAPVFTNFTNVTSDAIQFNWSANNNPAGTLYKVKSSTAPDPLNPGTEVVFTSDTYNTYLSSSGLNANTTYYFRVAAVNHNNIITDYTTAQGTSTLANAPVFNNFTGVTASAMQFNWSANGNRAGTLYRVKSSTAADPLSPAGAVVESSDTYNLYLSSSGLNANTTYYFRVAAINNNDIITAYTAAQGTSTLANAPVFDNFTGVTASIIQFNWTANGNRAGTLYRVKSSTAPDPLSPAGALVESSDTYNLSLSSTGLNANTTYYFRVAAVNHNNIITDYTTAQGTSTLANVPVFNNFTGVTASAMQFNWSANGNPAGTLYRVKTSTAPDPLSPAGAVVVSSDTYNLYLSSAGLNANTTYYFRVAAINNNDIITAYTTAKGTSTLVANAPVFDNFTGVTASAVQFNWLANNNPAGTLYRVKSSTSPDPLSPAGAVVASSDTYNLSLSSAGLNANTTYYFRVAAINNNDVATDYTTAQGTSTLANAPVFNDFTEVTASAMQFNWLANNNPVGTLYRVKSSTAQDPLSPAGAVVVSSDTYNLYLSSAGLNANTTYYFRVAGVNNNGIITDYTTAQGTSTLANAPVFDNFTDVTASIIQFNWTANGNRAGTLYRVKSSTAPDPLSPAGAVVVSSDTYNLYLSSAGLVANTTHYFRVAGVNNNNIITDYTTARGTSTLANAPVFDNFTGVTASAMQFNWLANGNRAGTLYRVKSSTAPDPLSPAGAVVESSDTYNLSLSSAGLNANTTYYFRVAAINNNNIITDYTASQGTSTLVANAPLFVDFTNVYVSSIQFNWSANGNPAGTLYRVKSSTAPDPLSPAGAVVASSDTYNLSLSSAGLNANTTCYFRVAGINNNDVATAYTTAQGTSTLVANAPVFVDFTNVYVSSIQFNWSANGNAAGTLYRVKSSTASDPLSPAGAVVSSSDTYNLYLSSAGLNANTTYYFRVAGINHNDVATDYTTSQGTSTLAAIPADLKFSGITASKIKLDWSANGNRAGTLYRVKASTASDPLSPAGAVVSSSDTYNLFLSSTGLTEKTTYYFVAAAINNNSIITSYTAAQSTVTLAAGQLGAPVIVAITNVYVTSMTAKWELVTDATGYTLAASTNSGNPPSPVWSSSATLVVDSATVYEADPLKSNVTYYLFVRANGDQASSPWSAYPGTSTLANIPVFTDFTNVTADAIQFNWSANGNAAGTLYRVKSSTASDPLSPAGAVVASSDTYNLSLSSAGLDGNTTYYFRVAGVNNNSIVTDYTTVQSTLIFAEAPVFKDFTDVTASTIQFNWSANGNRAGTLYRVKSSTAPDPLSPAGAVVASSDTYNLYLSSAGLNANTTYYFRVAAIDNNGVITAYTTAQGTSTLVANAPVFDNFTGVTAGAIQFNWSANGNPSGTLYRVKSSTAPDPLSPAGAVVASSDTYNLSLSSEGLNANTTYYFRVAGINHNDVATAYTAVQGTSTLANAPVFDNFTGMTAGAMQFNWLANGNRAGTLYRVKSSTAPDPLSPAGAVVASSDTYNLYLSSAGLVANTTYYFRVAGVNNNGIITDYTTAQGTSTLANVPVFDNFTNVTAAAMQFNWSANGNPAGTLYRVKSSTAPDPLSPAGAVVVSSDTYNLYLSSSGLNANTTYYFRVAGVNNNNIITDYTTARGTSTLANAPVFDNFTGVTTGAMQFNWTANGNRAGTLYRVKSSTAPDPLSPAGAVVVSSDTYNLYLSSAGLNVGQWQPRGYAIQGEVLNRARPFKPGRRGCGQFRYI
ncbi:MAG: hypothetical protein HY796_11245 [Elusimicrobia bacterium]|nr:hypothetical protein [Elusimicrobiota bacterium]